MKSQKIASDYVQEDVVNGTNSSSSFLRAEPKENSAEIIINLKERSLTTLDRLMAILLSQLLEVDKKIEAGSTTFLAISECSENLRMIFRFNTLLSSTYHVDIVVALFKKLARQNYSIYRITSKDILPNYKTIKEIFEDHTDEEASIMKELITTDPHDLCIGEL